MFSSIDKTYFGKRVVKSVSEKDEKGLVTVVFADDQKPSEEKMHETEWEAGKSEKAIEKPDQMQEWFVKRTSVMRQAVISKVVEFNPRFTDLKKVVSWIVEGVNVTYSNVVSKVFGLENFDTQATVDIVLKRLEDDGQKVDEGWTEVEKTILKLVREEKVLVNQITTEAFFGSIQKKIENLISEGVALALGGSDEARRCDVIERIINEHAQNPSPTGHEGVGGDNEDSSISSDQSQDQPSPQGEDNQNAETGAS